MSSKEMKRKSYAGMSRKDRLMSMIRRHKVDPTGEKALRRKRKKSYGSVTPDKQWRQPIDNSFRPSTSGFGEKRTSIFQRNHSIPKHHQAYSHRVQDGHREMPTKDGPGPGEYRLQKLRSGTGITRFSKLSHLKGSHLDAAFSLTKDNPGPGKYKIMPDPVPRNDAKPPGFDVARFPRPPSPRAPAPDAYRPNTAYIHSRVCGNPCLSAAKAPSDIEMLLKRVSILPGPADYRAGRSSLKTKGAALDREIDNTEIDMALKHSSKIPGPLDYAAEAFPKPENDMFASLRRAVQKHFIPNTRLLVHKQLVEYGCKSHKM